MGVPGIPEGLPGVHAHDGSSLPFMVEELISQGATFLAVDATSPYFNVLDQVPEIFKQRIVKIDEDHKCTAQIKGVMAPILDETKVEFDSPYSARFNRDSSPGAEAAAMLCMEHLRPFLLGLEYELQVEVDLEAVRRRILILDQSLSSRDARAHLAMLKQIFGAYERREVNELTFAPATPSQRAEAFLHFVEDVTYQHLSKERRLFGFPALVGRAADKFDRLAQK
jgi:hypothetical protein